MEVWQDDDDRGVEGRQGAVDDGTDGFTGWSVRVLYGGVPLRSSHPDLAEMDMIPLDVLLRYFEDLVGEKGEKVVESCREEETNRE